MTSAEVPSGKTSQIFTDSDAAGFVAQTLARSTGWPTIGPGGGSISQVSERSSSSRWSPDSPQGRCPAQSIQAAVPTSGTTSSDTGAVRSRVASVTGGTVGSVTHQPSCRSRSISGRVEVRTNTSQPVLVGARAAQPVVEPARPSPRRSRSAVRASRSPGRRAPRGRRAAGAVRRAGRARRRCGTSCCGSRRPSRRRSSPDTRSARSPGVVPPSRTDPWSQYAPCRFSRSQVSTHGSLVSSRRSHSSYQPSPQTAGTGGSTFIGVM